MVPGTSVFPLSETGVLGDFWGPENKRLHEMPMTSLEVLVSLKTPCTQPDHTETERKPDVPASPRGEALFRCARPSGSGAGGVQTAKASRKQSSLSGKESAQGCIPKRLLGRPD